MANRRFTSQFSYSFERMPVRLMGAFTQVGSTGSAATLVDNGITWTAVTMGSAGNAITVALVAGGTAGSEVVTVTNRAISVAIQSTVTTRTQVLTAIQASAAASALVSISVSSGGTAATLLAATHLATGTDTAITTVNASGNTSTSGVGSGMTLSQIGTGLWQITLQDPYASLLAANIMIQKASSTDLKAQLKSAATAFGTSQTIVFRTEAVATNTNLASGDVIYIDLTLRNSS